MARCNYQTHTIAIGIKFEYPTPIALTMNKTSLFFVVAVAMAGLLVEAGRQHYKMRMRNKPPAFASPGGGLAKKDHLKKWAAAVPQPTNPPTKSPTPYPTNLPTLSPSTSRPSISIAEQNELVTCISVIDENDNRSLQSQWNAFKNRFPDRPFCILRPTPVSDPLWRPSDYLTTTTATTNITNIFATTTRDSADVSNPANWFNLCNLEAGVALGLTNVLLFIDESGSMTRETIDTALALFRAEAAMNGFNILPTVYNSNEDWVSPCLDTEL